MARPLWTGAVSFGLVTIPVEVHTAVRDRGPRFHFLRRSDKSRIRYKKVAAKDEEPVSKEELVKGYEYEKGRYVVLTPEDFEQAALHRDRTIDLIDFVNADEIDERFFDKPYYLLPGRGGTKAYALLREAMRDANRLGVAKFVLRSKQHLAALQAIGDALVLTTMRFREELVRLSEFDFPAARGLRNKDLQLAGQLINTLEATWDPDKYTDEYRQNLMKVIEARRKHQKPHLEVAEEEASGKIVDLMERLRKSLGEQKTRRSRAKHKSKRKSGKRQRKAA